MALKANDSAAASNFVSTQLTSGSLTPTTTDITVSTYMNYLFISAAFQKSTDSYASSGSITIPTSVFKNNSVAYYIYYKDGSLLGYIKYKSDTKITIWVSGTVKYNIYGSVLIA